mgnify:CR=1 FL=1
MSHRGAQRPAPQAARAEPPPRAPWARRRVERSVLWITLYSSGPGVHGGGQRALAELRAAAARAGLKDAARRIIATPLIDRHRFAHHRARPCPSCRGCAPARRSPVHGARLGIFWSRPMRTSCSIRLRTMGTSPSRRRSGQACRRLHFLVQHSSCNSNGQPATR